MLPAPIWPLAEHASCGQNCCDASIGSVVLFIIHSMPLDACFFQALLTFSPVSGELPRCILRREISPLEPGEEVEVVGMASDEECMHEMFVLIRWKQRQLAVPLMQLAGIQVDEETQQAIEDWHYWVKQGYEL